MGVLAPSLHIESTDSMIILTAMHCCRIGSRGQDYTYNMYRQVTDLYPVLSNRKQILATLHEHVP